MTPIQQPPSRPGSKPDKPSQERQPARPLPDKPGDKPGEGDKPNLPGTPAPARPAEHELPDKPGDKPEQKAKRKEGEEVPVSEDPTLSPNEKVSRTRGF